MRAPLFMPLAGAQCVNCRVYGQEPPDAKRHRSQDVTGSGAAAAPSGSADQSAPSVDKAHAQAVPMEVSFASAGAQDVNAINDIGETMAATSASTQQTQVLQSC